MRQVVKDRVARIDKEIGEIQELYKLAYEREKSSSKQFFSSAYGTKVLEEKCQALIEKKEEILAKAIFGSLSQDKFERVLEDRMFNYECAMEELKILTTELREIAATTPEDSGKIKEISGKIGAKNRIVAVYKASVDNWMAKKISIQEKRTVKANVVKYKEMQEITRIEAGPDPEVLKILQAPRNASGKIIASVATNETNLETLNNNTPTHIEANEQSDASYEAYVRSVEESKKKERVIIDFGSEDKEEGE